MRNQIPHKPQKTKKIGLARHTATYNSVDVEMCASKAIQEAIRYCDHTARS